MKKKGRYVIQANTAKKTGGFYLDVTDWRPGDHLQFLYPEYGYIADRTLVKNSLLRLSHVYTLKEIDVGHWVTYLTLHEVPGRFNSVHFAHVLG